jgi:peptidyl-prolyl cis-trans isomerase A (cyclophilin A)
MKFKYASALLALIALQLIPIACKDKTPVPPSEATVPPPAPPPTPADPASPDSFRVKFATTKGDFTVDVLRPWAPKGADRFYRLVTEGYFKDIRFFRVLPGFMAQFGMSSPAVNEKMDGLRISDDPVTQSNKRGMITFATAGPNTRTNQFFINYKDNAMLDAQGFAPFGRVVDGMKAVDALYSGYGEGAPNGAGPDQDSIRQKGNEYLQRAFPKLDYIKSATIVK